MENWITLFSDLCVVVFDLMLYTQMTTLRKNKARSRKILYAGCVVIIAFYILSVFVFHWPASVSAFVCMTLPSLALFWFLCRYRDSRFFLTFCFVDTVSLIVGYIARYAGILFGNTGGLLAIAVMLPSFIFIYRAGKPYFRRYREALEIIDRGWNYLTFSAALIYITMIFCAVYPRPLIERPDYFIPYLVISAMVLSFYTVFLINIAVTRKVYEQSIRLKEQQKWFRAAYVDALTGIPNRAAYMEKIHELERMKDQTVPVAIIVMDMDRFKGINDTWGHSMGDEVLRQAANFISGCFSDEGSTVYRIGGDEFAVIAVGGREDELSGKLEAVGADHSGAIPYSISAGYSFIDRSEKNPADQAFARADAMMYSRKTQKKHH